MLLGVEEGGEDLTPLLPDELLLRCELLLAVLDLSLRKLLSLDFLKVPLELSKGLCGGDSLEAVDLTLSYPNPLRAEVAAEGEAVDSDGICDRLGRSELLLGGDSNLPLSFFPISRPIPRDNLGLVTT